jgi:hypothetical protein
MYCQMSSTGFSSAEGDGRKIGVMFFRPKGYAKVDQARIAKATEAVPPMAGLVIKKIADAPRFSVDLVEVEGETGPIIVVWQVDCELESDVRLNCRRPAPSSNSLADLGMTVEPL